MDLLNETIPLVEKVATLRGYKLQDIRSRTGYRVYSSTHNAAGINLQDVDMYLRNKGEQDTIDYLIKEKFK